MAGPPGGIIWLASYPKSGNTWVRMFLASYLNDGRPISVNAMPQELTYSDHRGHDYQSVSAYYIENLTVQQILLLRGAVLLKLLAEAIHRPTIVKTHNANSTVGEIKLIPRALTRSAIFVVRDPRDVLVSYTDWTGTTTDEMIGMMNDRATIIPNPESSGATSVFHYLGGWSHHTASWLDADVDTLVVKYERMHEDPEHVFREILEHIGWDVNPARIRRAIKSASFDKMQATEKKFGFSEKPSSVSKFFRTGAVGGWSEYLTKEESDRIIADHSEVMNRLGYL